LPFTAALFSRKRQGAKSAKGAKQTSICAAFCTSGRSSRASDQIYF